MISATLSSAQTIIGSLPYTINIPGTYVLNQSLSYPSGSGIAITVKAPNVTINLGGNAIINTSDQTTTTAIGIGANNLTNITVENGEILGFKYGIYLNGPSSGATFNLGHVLQGLRFAYCTYAGIYLNFADNSLIQNCQLSSLGFTGGGVGVGTFSAGIYIISRNGGTRVYRCQVLHAATTGFVGIGGVQGSYWEQNLATNCEFGFAFGNSNAAYRDNATFGCTTPFSGGNDFGGNHSQ
jgi:Right handed beta helix region